MSQRALEIDGIRCDPEEVQLWIATYAATAYPASMRSVDADQAVREYRKRCVLADEAP